MRTSVTPTLTRAGRNKLASKLSSAVTGGRMAFAFWFDPTAINGNYAEWAAARVFTSRILQCSCETTRIRVGDLLYYNLSKDKVCHEEIAYQLQTTNARPGLMRQTMEQALWHHRIHVMYCDELSEGTALTLHEYLLREPRYMGCYGVDPTRSRASIAIIPWDALAAGLQVHRPTFARRTHPARPCLTSAISAPCRP